MHPPPPHTHTQKKTGEWARKTRVSTRQQGYKQENIDKILWEDERVIFIAVIKAATKGWARHLHRHDSDTKVSKKNINLP